MKKLHFIVSTCCCILLSNICAWAQFEGCPNHQGDEMAHLQVRLKDPASDSLITTNLLPGKVYLLEVYEDPYNPAPPHYKSYQSIGIEGNMNGFKLYQNAKTASETPNGNYPQIVIQKGVSKNVGSSGGVSKWGIIKDKGTNEPVKIQVRGQCNPTSSNAAVKFFKKTIILL